MELLAIGGDKRYAYMIRDANKRGVLARAFGLEKAGLFDIPIAEAKDISAAEAVVMPNPFGKTWNMPYSRQKVSLDDILNSIADDATVLVFGKGDTKGTALDNKNVVRLDSDDVLMCELARQTAEGAIHAVCDRAAYELHSAGVLIIGYGRLGKALHRVLNGYQASVTVLARREEALCEAEKNGAKAIHISDMKDALQYAHIVFSTPPERVVDAHMIDFLQRNALLVDLSGEPYGVDIEAARSKWLHAWREPALPGRYCPHSAGVAMLEAVIRALEKERERA